MVGITIETKELLKWSRHINRIPRRSNAAIARALNTFGRGVVRSAAATIAQQTDMAIEDVMAMIGVAEASPDDLTWEMDSSQLVPPSLDWSRPWDTTVARDSSQYDQQTLLRLITSEDEAVCIICQDAAEGGPYTMEELSALKVPGYLGGNGLVHENCRCLLTQWNSTRKLPVTFDTVGSTTPQPVTMKQLGRTLASEMAVVLKAKD